jgi:catechol 2,3-dioxygenase-like lactoylglutathione lyase family enzyme
VASPTAVEHVDFVSVPVTDMERSTRWYRETLGLEQTVEGAWPEFRVGDNVYLYLIDPTNVGQAFGGPNSGGIALRVADVAEAKAALEAKGVEFDTDVFDTGVCHMAPFRDPDGNAFLLHRRYAPDG